MLSDNLFINSPWILLGEEVYFQPPLFFSSLQGIAPRRGTPYLARSSYADSPENYGAVARRGWDGAASIDSLAFSQGAPVTVEPQPQTRVKLLWDADFLYIRFICREDHEIYSPYRGHDAPYYRADVAEIFVDPVGDGREFVEIEVSPDNGVFDQVHLLTTDPQSGDDGVLGDEIINRDMWSFPGWNIPGLKHAASRWARPDGSKGWLVDVALPAVLLRRTGRSHFAPMTLRANFLRYDHPLRGKEREFVSLNWSPVIAGRPHRSPARMGYLVLTDN